jgi:periplasmic protein TonB
MVRPAPSFERGLSVKPPLREVDSTHSDILPSLFLRQPHRDPRNFAVSVLLHLCVAALIALALHRAVTNHDLLPAAAFTPIHLSDPVFIPSGDDSGGGRREPTLASLGVIPTIAVRPLMTPTTHVPDDPPALLVPQTISSSTIPTILKGAVGDPHGVRGPTSDGPGTGRGIGDGPGDGIGSGSHSGWSPLLPGNGVSMPRVIFDPEPEYTDEARRLKQQGNVVLACVVGPDGRVHDARVERALGLGLDEKALEAVRKWKFEPSRYNGKPVAVKIMVEVNFRMY